MKRISLVSLVAAFLLCSPKGASAGFIFTFDEFGNGRISVNGGPQTDLLGSLMADPSQTGNPLVLTWLLGPTVGTLGNGTVLVHEGSLLTDPLSDALRFTDSLGNLSGFTADRLIFYSLAGGGAPADTGLPSNVRTGALADAFETNGQFTFTATGPNVYNGTSDGTLTAVPEPSSLLLLGSGIGLLIRRRLPTNRGDSPSV